MKKLLEKCFRTGAAFALLGGMVCATPAALQAKTNAEVSVDVTVTVHGSDINVSKDVLEGSVEKLLDAAEIKVVEEGAGKGIVELEIEIYKDDDDDDDDGVKDKDDDDGDGDGDGKGFIIVCDWDDDDDPEAEKNAATQDQIDDIVEDTIDDFITFMKDA